MRDWLAAITERSGEDRDRTEDPKVVSGYCQARLSTQFKISSSDFESIFAWGDAKIFEEIGNRRHVLRF